MAKKAVASTYVEIDVNFRLLSKDFDFDAFFDQVADELHDLPGPVDRDLAGNLKTQVLTFCFTFADQIDPDRALKKALTMTRTSIHAAGGATIGWEMGPMTVNPAGTAQLVSA